MGLRTSFSVTQFGYPLELFTEQDYIEVDYSEGCEVFIETFIDVANDLVPVDTGALQASIDAWTDGVEIECVAEEDYAQYVEYGTIKMEAQPYFEPALLEAWQQAQPLWQEAYEEARGELLSQSSIGGALGGSASPGFIGLVADAIIAGMLMGIIQTAADIIFVQNSLENRFIRGDFLKSIIDIEIT